mmetsp:Transcript_109/g.408  ORF Transcript_109/g.408 Transcript_109/m.408 type:complete len:343 (+) Transcript_109:378-1406(+)
MMKTKVLPPNARQPHHPRTLTRPRPTLRQAVRQRTAVRPQAPGGAGKLATSRRVSPPRQGAQDHGNSHLGRTVARGTTRSRTRHPTAARRVDMGALTRECSTARGITTAHPRLTITNITITTMATTGTTGTTSKTLTVPGSGVATAVGMAEGPTPTTTRPTTRGTTVLQARPRATVSPPCRSLRLLPRRTSTSLESWARLIPTHRPPRLATCCSRSAAVGFRSLNSGSQLTRRSALTHRVPPPSSTRPSRRGSKSCVPGTRRTSTGVVLPGAGAAAAVAAVAAVVGVAPPIFHPQLMTVLPSEARGETCLSNGGCVRRSSYLFLVCLPPSFALHLQLLASKE